MEENNNVQVEQPVVEQAQDVQQPVEETKPKKKFPVWAIVLIVVGVLLFLGIILIPIIFTAFVYPRIRSNLVDSTRCQGAICSSCSGKTCTCEYYDDYGELQGPIECPNPNYNE